MYSVAARSSCPRLSLNRRLRDQRRLSIAGQMPPRPGLQGCSAAVAAVRPSCGPGGVFGKNEDRKGWQGASRGTGSP